MCDASPLCSFVVCETLNASQGIFDVEYVTTRLADQGKCWVGQGFRTGETCGIIARMETCVCLWRWDIGSDVGTCSVFVSITMWMAVGECAVGVFGGTWGAGWQCIGGLRCSWLALLLYILQGGCCD